MDNTTINISEKNKKKKSMDPKKKKILCITTLVVGLIVLVVGVVFLVLNLTKGSQAQDGEYLVSAGEWNLSTEVVVHNCTDSIPPQCSDDGENAGVIDNSVVWKFTEIGKGSLTTDGGEHSYDFIWALEDGTLKIETNWLYELENEYNYSLDQNAGTLTLTDNEKNEYRFTAQQ